MKISAKEMILTASIGIVVHDGSQETAQEMLREGELAMLRAKRAGADHIEFFNPAMREEDESKLPLESDLRKALERQQIAILYQPITRLASNQLAGFEALMRWDHPTRGRIGPEDFIPIAEELGLIVELGNDRRPRNRLALENQCQRGRRAVILWSFTIHVVGNGPFAPRQARPRCDLPLVRSGESRAPSRSRGRMP